MRFDVFTPAGSGSISASASSASATLPKAGASLELFNDGTVTCFVTIGASGLTAAVTDYPIGPGVTKMMSRDSTIHTNIAAITSAGTTTLRFTTGDGA